MSITHPRDTPNTSTEGEELKGRGPWDVTHTHKMPPRPEVRPKSALITPCTRASQYQGTVSAAYCMVTTREDQLEEWKEGGAAG